MRPITSTDAILSETNHQYRRYPECETNQLYRRYPSVRPITSTDAILSVRLISCTDAILSVRSISCTDAILSVRPISSTNAILKTNQLLTHVIQWNPTIIDTTGTQDFVRYSEVSLSQGLSVGVVLCNPAVEYSVAAFSELSFAECWQGGLSTLQK